MRKPTLQLVISEKKKHKDGKCPVSLRVTIDQIPRLIGLKESMKKENFEKIWKSKHPRDSNLNQKLKLDKDYIQKGQKILDQMEKEGIEIFDFNEFKDRYKGNKFEKNSNILTMFDKLINQLHSNDQISTSDTYKHSKNLLIKYFKPKNDEIKYNSIKTRHLRDFEKYTIDELNFSVTTLSIYLRCLRAIYNKAISEGIITSEISPFNDKKDPYKIPMNRNVKKALKPEEIVKLAEFDDFRGSPKLKARDFWLLSFYCYGMNICDILQLKNENIQGSELYFYRKKTKQSNRGDQKPVNIAILEPAMKIIDLYRNKDNSPKSFLFPILELSDNAETIRNKTKNFTRFINQHIKKIAEIMEINPKISTYYARHSFATIARNRGTNVEMISVMLAHSDISTTQNYLDSFNSEQTRKLSETIYQDL